MTTPVDPSIALGDQLTGDGSPSPVAPPVAPAPASMPMFTAEQVEKFRADERNKLQSKLDSTNAKLAELAEAQAAREAAEAQAAEEAAAAARAAAEADLDAKSLLEIRQREWEQKFEQLQKEQREKEALLAHERKYLEMKAYIQGRWAEETAKQTIHPTFKDYIDGNTPEEVEASLALAAQKTQAMAEEIMARETGRTQQAFQTGQAVSTRTGPTDFGHVAETGDELDPTQMSYADFVKNRHNLIRSTTGNGIFG